MKRTLRNMGYCLSISTSLVAADVCASDFDKSENIALVGATVVSPHLASPINNAVVTIDGGKISAIGPASLDIGNNYKKIDVSGRWLVPGYIDSHVHFFQSGSAFTRPDSFDFSNIQPYSEDREWVTKNMADTFERYIKSGVTSVVDMCGPRWTFNVRTIANKSDIAPTVASAGPCVSSFSAEALDLGDNDPVFAKVSSSEQAVALVSNLMIDKPDLIKIVWSQDSGHTPEQLHDLFAPAIKYAHERGVIVAIHALELENAKLAVKAGADILVHGVLLDELDEEFVALAKKHDVIYMPTLAVHAASKHIAEHALEFSEHEELLAHPDILNSFKEVSAEFDKAGMMVKLFRKYVPMVDASEVELAKLSEQEQNMLAQLRRFFSKEVTAAQRRNVKRMHDEGVPLALGTDAGNPAVVHGGSLLTEMKAWVDAGIPLSSILKATTMNNALVAGRQADVGSIEVGKIADLLVLKKNPSISVDNMASIEIVIKDGRTIKQ
ncbi:MAG: amidohydrolase family protein [Kordiimonas sp.]